MKPSALDVSEVIETQKVGWFVVRLILVSWLVTFFDGYDLNVIAFAAPYLATEYQLDTLMLGNVFSVGVAGTIFGGLLFGYLGDRLGRRIAIITATATFSALTLALAFADSWGRGLAGTCWLQAYRCKTPLRCSRCALPSWRCVCSPLDWYTGADGAKRPLRRSTQADTRLPQRFPRNRATIHSR